MAITPLPSAPQTTDTPQQFNSKAFAWVQALDTFVTEANAQADAVDSAVLVAEDWASKTDGNIDTDYSAKAWAIGGTGVSDTATRGAAKEWAIETSGTVDGTEFSAKEYALGTQSGTGGSAKSWAQDADAVNGAGANDRSSKAWAQGASMTGATLGGSSKDWAQNTSSTVDGSEYSSKEYAVGTQIRGSTGSAKDWAQYTGGTVDGTNYSAKFWAEGALSSASDAEAAQIAAEAAQTAAEAAQTAAESAQSAAESARDTTLAAYDQFDDRYLGAKSSDPSVDNDGNPLVAGALYFNTTDEVMKLYTGSAWVAAYVSGGGFLAASNNLSDVSSAAISRQNLGLGNTDSLTFVDLTLTGNIDVSGESTFVEVTETVYTLGISGTVDLNPANGSIQTSAISGTITFTDSLVAGQTIVLMITGGGSNTVNWPTVTWYTPLGNAAPTLTAADTLVFWKVSTTLYGAYVGSGV